MPSENIPAKVEQTVNTNGGPTRRVPYVSSGRDMSKLGQPSTGDVQASTPDVPLALSRAGVTGVHKAIRIRRGSSETVMAAEIECTGGPARGPEGVRGAG